MPRSINTGKTLLDIPYFASESVAFSIGDTVRSYRSAFDEIKPFKNDFIEGVVIAMESWIKPNDYLKVKWHTHNYFGTIYSFKMPIDGRDTFSISVRSPHLVKQSTGQLSIAL